MPTLVWQQYSTMEIMALYNYFNRSQNHSEISTVAVRGTLEVRENLELEETSFMDAPYVEIWNGIVCPTL